MQECCPRAMLRPPRAAQPPSLLCSQGPLKHTRDAFWQMAVEQRCGAVVMLTNTGACLV